MMTGKFVEYNWSDILRLILADAGLMTEEDQRQHAETWYVGRFEKPEHIQDTCIRIKVYDKPFSERVQQHAGESASTD